MTIDAKPDSKKKKSDVREVKPSHTIRDGGICAKIWARQSATGFPYYEYSISRSWKLHSGRSGYSQNFFAKNQEQLVKVITEASLWIAENEPKLIQGSGEAIAA